jgi:hypothetical protein
MLVIMAQGSTQTMKNYVDCAENSGANHPISLNLYFTPSIFISRLLCSYPHIQKQFSVQPLLMIRLQKLSSTTNPDTALHHTNRQAYKQPMACALEFDLLGLHM